MNESDPRTICYCFGHTDRSIREEIERTGRSTVSARIAAKVKAGECSCETLNPKGSCCLGDVNKAVKEVLTTLGRKPPSAAPTSTEGQAPSHGCCTVPVESPASPETPPRAERAGILAAGASVFSAAIASACCWLPLALVSFGASAAGLLAAFEEVRPFFLALAPVLLGIGFYFAYFRREACAADLACPLPRSRFRRLNRAMLWVASVVILAVGFFPNHVVLLFRQRRPPAGSAEFGPNQTVTFRIEGMTCEGCAIHVEDELAAVSGVYRATVSYTDGSAIVTFDAARRPDVASLVAAIEKAGYRLAPDR